MQTFLPYPDITLSLRSLDYRRLGKQRLETKQILQTLLGESEGWKNHPAVKMWEGHITLLREYGIVCCDQWTRQGYTDNLRQWFVEVPTVESIEFPRWWGGPIHLSHQSNLIRKDSFYASLFPGVPNDLPYVWPVP